MRLILLAVISLVIFTACSKQSKEYKKFVETYGSETRTFCDGKFLMRETFLSEDAEAPQEYLINSNVCKD